MHFTSSDRSIECVPSMKIITTTDRRKKAMQIHKTEREREEKMPLAHRPQQRKYFAHIHQING